ncbi:hypothetical protein K435DRAFT_837691 [Dendrothele bispora CBS 962.96]|uniref:NB-ARC domain-containing protein n=1 Tax=Dendrothele bispora (strain CBS 962.96) TaxID=1314807 RepID=A0A4S8MA78_DENBC|nr:hypothetical protein K435DRAFT_837691 [Dendrothele bispora CBS 962.96]
MNRHNRQTSILQSGAITQSLELLQSLGDLTKIPGLKGIAGIIGVLVENSNATDRNREEWTSLINDVGALAVAVTGAVQDCGGHLENDILDHIANLCNKLEHVKDSLLALTDRNLALRGADQSRDAIILRRLDRDIQQCTDIFTMQCSTSIVKEVRRSEKGYSEILEGIKEVREMLLNDIKSESSKVNKSLCLQRMHDQPLLPLPRNLIGRREELERVVNTILEAQNAARIALLGTGGIGKTALASQVILDERIAERFGNRRYFIACDAANNKDDLLNLVSSKFNIKGDQLQKQVIKKLNQDKTILVLDNFESPWETIASRSEVENFLTLLTSEAENLTLLITMRGSQRPAAGKVAWTHPFIQLQPLDMESAKQLLKSVVDYPDNDPNVEGLLEAVECLPLAVELLGAQMETDSPKILLQRWQVEQSSMLTRFGTHHQSLDTSIQMSINSSRMTSAALDLLKVLSLLPDGVELKQLSDVFSSLKEPKKALATLLHISLAYYDRNKRIRVLSPIRSHMVFYHFPEYKNIVPILTYYMGLVQLTASLGGPQGIGIVKRIIPEIGNLHAVVNLVLGPKLTQYVEDNLLHGAIRAAIDLSRFFRYTELGNTETLKLALSIVSEKMSDEILKADILYNMAWSIRNSEREGLCRKAMTIYEETNNLSGQAECNWLLSKIYKGNKRNHDKASQHMKIALSIARRSGNKHCEAKCLASLSELTYHEGDVEVALQQSQDALQLFRPLEDYTNIGITLLFIGKIENNRSRYSQSLQYLNEAKNFLKKAGAYTHELTVWIELGDVWQHRGNFLEAQKAYEQVWAVVQERGLEKSYHAAYAWLSLAEAAAGLQDETTSRKWLDKAMEMFEAKRIVHGRLFCEIVYGDLAIDRGAEGYDEAAIWYRKAVKDSRLTQAVNDEALANLKYGILRTAQSEIELGLRHLMTALVLYRKSDNTAGVGKGLFRLGGLLEKMGERTGAVSVLEAAWVVCRGTEAVVELSECGRERERLTGNAWK